MTSTRYIPPGSIEIRDKQSDAIAYLYPSPQNGKPAARVFYGKQSKPVLWCYFANEQQREKRVGEMFNDRRTIEAMKAETREQRKQPHTLKVGDILDCSWGYDQTNVDYYQVTRVVSPHSIEIRKIGAKSVSEAGSSMSDRCMPVPDQFIGEPMIKRSNSTNSVYIASYASASLWGGKSNYRSWYA